MDLSPLNSEVIINNLIEFYQNRECTLHSFEWITQVWVGQDGAYYCLTESGEVQEIGPINYC